MYQQQGNFNNGNNNGGGNGNFPPSVNTIGFELINVPIGCVCKLAYFNSTMSVAIGAFTPGITLDWRAMSELQRTQVNLSYSDLCDLDEVCSDIKSSIKKDGTFETTGVFCGSKRNNIIEISNGSNIGKDDGIYLVIYYNIGMSNTPQTMAVYTFAKTTVLKNYDYTTGTNTSHEVKQGEFKKFRKAVQKAMEALTMAEAHAGERAHSKEKSDTFTCLQAMADMLGGHPQVKAAVDRQMQNRANNGPQNAGGYNQAPQTPQGNYANYGNTNHVNNIQSIAGSGYGEELDLPNNV